MTMTGDPEVLVSALALLATIPLACVLIGLIVHDAAMLGLCRLHPLRIVGHVLPAAAALMLLAVCLSTIQTAWLSMLLPGGGGGIWWLWAVLVGLTVVGLVIACVRAPRGPGVTNATDTENINQETSTWRGRRRLRLASPPHRFTLVSAIVVFAGTMLGSSLIG
jgi:hypothetical protein